MYFIVSSKRHSNIHFRKLGPRLKVVGLIDPFIERSQAVLAKKRASFVASAYENTETYKSVEEFALKAKSDQKPKYIHTINTVDEDLIRHVD